MLEAAGAAAPVGAVCDVGTAGGGTPSLTVGVAQLKVEPKATGSCALKKSIGTPNATGTCACGCGDAIEASSRPSLCMVVDCNSGMAVQSTARSAFDVWPRVQSMVLHSSAFAAFAAFAALAAFAAFAAFWMSLMTPSIRRVITS